MGFAEARDMCAMEILKCEEYRAAYADIEVPVQNTQNEELMEQEKRKEQQLQKAATGNKNTTKSKINQRPIRGNIESYNNKSENVWTELALKREYGNCLLDNPAMDLNSLKQKSGWTDLNIDITTQNGESFMRAELMLQGEKIVGLASNKKQAKATACQVICMLMGFYKPD